MSVTTDQRREKRSKATKASPARAKQLRKAATHIAGLDDVLNGGVPCGRTTLVSGGPGCGKSVLGLEFLYRGAIDGEPGIFVAFEERAEAVRQNALTFGWDLAALEQENRLFVLDARLDPEAVVSGNFNLKGLLASIGGKAAEMGATRIVIDAVDVLLRVFDDPSRERTELYALHEWLTDREMTTLLTVKAANGHRISSQYEFLDYMADCTIQLDQRVTNQVSTRRLRVIKYRGSDSGRNEYPYAIGSEGITLFPVCRLTLQHKPLGDKVSSGHPRLDAMLAGGYRRGACVLISGTSGTGKTTLASIFARSACRGGEKLLFISFEESQQAMLDGMLSPGIDLRPAVKAGKLRFQSAFPEALGAEEHLIRKLLTIQDFEPDHVVIDAISACKRMGTEQAAFEYVMRVVNTCKERGITSILLNQTEGFRDEHEVTGIGISSIVDTVIFLRYIEVGGEINRMLLVMKSRGAKHANQYREFRITDDGIDIPDVYVGEGGVLTGAARQEQEAKEALARQRRDREVLLKEREVADKRAAMEAHAAQLRAELETAEAELETLRLELQTAQEGRDVRAQLRGEDANGPWAERAIPRRRRKAPDGKGDAE
jgi:circadian clock protein KaiC